MQKIQKRHSFLNGIFKINKIKRSLIIYEYNLFIEINVQYFAGYPISIIRHKQSVKVLKDDADWITSKILYIYVNK